MLFSTLLLSYLIVIATVSIYMLSFNTNL